MLQSHVATNLISQFRSLEARAVLLSAGSGGQSAHFCCCKLSPMQLWDEGLVLWGLGAAFDFWGQNRILCFS